MDRRICTALSITKFATHCKVWFIVNLLVERSSFIAKAMNIIWFFVFAFPLSLSYSGSHYFVHFVAINPVDAINLCQVELLQKKESTTITISMFGFSFPLNKLINDNYSYYVKKLASSMGGIGDRLCMLHESAVIARSDMSIR